MYIANLPPSFKETDLENLLSQYGQVISTRILRDQQGQSKGRQLSRLHRDPRRHYKISNMICDICFFPPADINKGVGFARMESREKCEQIIQIFNGKQLPGAKDPLLVKFADGGSKKKSVFKSPDPNARTWREVTEVKFHSI